MIDPTDLTEDALDAFAGQERARDKVSRHKTPGRGGSAPIGNAPRVPVRVTLDRELLARARAAYGPRGLSEALNRLLRGDLDYR